MDGRADGRSGGRTCGWTDVWQRAFQIEWFAQGVFVQSELPLATRILRGDVAAQPLLREFIGHSQKLCVAVESGGARVGDMVQVKAPSRRKDETAIMLSTDDSTNTKKRDAIRYSAAALAQLSKMASGKQMSEQVGVYAAFEANIRIPKQTLTALRRLSHLQIICMHMESRDSRCPFIRMSIRSSVRPSARSTVRPSVRTSVRPLDRSTVRPSVRPSIRPCVRSTVRPSEKKNERQIDKNRFVRFLDHSNSLWRMCL